MLIGFDEEFIAIDEPVQASNVSGNPDDVNVSIEVRLKQFSGCYESILITQSEIENFIGDLEKLDRDRLGEIALSSFWPNEFLLKIRSRGAHRHFLVEISLSRYQYIGSVEWKTLISGGFELDPKSIPSIRDSLKNLIH